MDTKPYHPPVKELIAMHNQTPLDVWLVSYGGSGTNMLANQLNKYMVCRNQLWENYLCHYPQPVKLDRRDHTKVIYLYDDPLRALYSQHRRGLMQINARKLCDLDNAEYKSPDDIGVIGYDYMRFEQQFDSWNVNIKGFDILAVKFDGLWDSLEVIRKHLSLPKKFVDEFPPQKKRNSSGLDADPILIDVYRRLQEKVNSRPSYQRFYTE